MARSLIESLDLDRAVTKPRSAWDDEVARQIAAAVREAAGRGAPRHVREGGCVGRVCCANGEQEYLHDRILRNSERYRSSHPQLATYARSVRLCRLADSPPSARGHAPVANEHTDAVLAELGSPPMRSRTCGSARSSSRAAGKDRACLITLSALRAQAALGDAATQPRSRIDEPTGQGSRQARRCCNAAARCRLRAAAHSRAIDASRYSALLTEARELAGETAIRAADATRRIYIGAGQSRVRWASRGCGRARVASQVPFGIRDPRALNQGPVSIACCGSRPRRGDLPERTESRVASVVPRSAAMRAGH